MRGRKTTWFIAFPLNDDGAVRGSIEDHPSAIRPVRQEDLHITVAYLGSVSKRKAGAAWKQVADFSPGAVEISFNQLKPFGPYSRPTAYGLSLSRGRDTVFELISSLRKDLLRAAGKKPGTGRIVPHVTIARPNRRLSREDTLMISEWRSNYDIPDVVIRLDEIALYTRSGKSTTGSFTIVERKSLIP